MDKSGYMAYTYGPVLITHSIGYIFYVNRFGSLRVLTPHMSLANNRLSCCGWLYISISTRLYCVIHYDFQQVYEGWILSRDKTIHHILKRSIFMMLHAKRELINSEELMQHALLIDSCVIEGQHQISRICGQAYLILKKNILIIAVS